MKMWMIAPDICLDVDKIPTEDALDYVDARLYKSMASALNDAKEDDALFEITISSIHAMVVETKPVSVYKAKPVISKTKTKKAKGAK
jgi:hypothetical protein